MCVAAVHQNPHPPAEFAGVPRPPVGAARRVEIRHPTSCQGVRRQHRGQHNSSTLMSIVIQESNQVDKNIEKHTAKYNWYNHITKELVQFKLPQNGHASKVPSHLRIARTGR